jgi:hypothetical protein
VPESHDAWQGLASQVVGLGAEWRDDGVTLGSWAWLWSVIVHE